MSFYKAESALGKAKRGLQVSEPRFGKPVTRVNLRSGTHQYAVLSPRDPAPPAYGDSSNNDSHRND